MLKSEKFGTKNLYRCLASILLVAALLMGCAKPQGGEAETEPQGTTQPQETVSSLQEALAAYADALSKESLDGLKLTIYYMDANIYLRCPMDTEGLIQGCNNAETASEDKAAQYSEYHKIIVNNEKLKDNTEVLCRLNANSVTQFEGRTRRDIRMCCRFENGDGDIILELLFGFTEEGKVVFINGIPTVYNDLFKMLLQTLIDENAWEGVHELLVWLYGRSVY